jgi:hypothetical protein
MAAQCVGALRDADLPAARIGSLTEGAAKITLA